LGTSKYQEFLNESDDEEFFNTKPVNRDGKEFEYDFKIDAFRDEIKFARDGSPRKSGIKKMSSIFMDGALQNQFGFLRDYVG